MTAKETKEKSVKHNKIKKAFKVILGIISAILIGAIGSGVWENFLSPTLKSLSGFVTSLIASVSTSYSNSLYIQAADINNCNDSSNVLGFIGIIMFASLLLYGLAQNKNNRVISKILWLLSEPWRVVSGPIVCAMMIFIMFFLMATNDTIFRIKHYSVMQMEIIRPYIGKEKYLMLRSGYMRMKNKNDFDDFLKVLYSYTDDIAKDIAKNDPEIEPFKIDKFEK